MSIDKFRLVVELRQHTSLIVERKDLEFFLRSTELRPKLNTFLRKKYKELHQSEGPPENWLIGVSSEVQLGENRAFNFRIRDMIYNSKDSGGSSVMDRDELIPLNGSERKDQFIKENKSYFYKRWLKNGQCSFTIFSKNKKLIEFIKNHLTEFFIQQNFGRAQSKGFGQFTVMSINGLIPTSIKTIEACLLKGAKKGVYKLKLEPNLSVFDQVSQFYSHLKKGLNHRTYKKSLLFKFFCKHYKDFPGWEKRAIKEWMLKEDETFFKESVLFNPSKIKIGDPLMNRNESCKASNTEVEDHWFIRALLGLPENYQFRMWEQRQYDALDKKKYPIPITLGYKTTTVNISNGTKKDGTPIEQFPSTIQLKLFANPGKAPKNYSYEVYIIPKDTGEIEGATFTFSAEVKKDDENIRTPNFYEVDTSGKKTPKSFTLSVPKDFHLSQFLDFVAEHQDASLKLEKLDHESE